MPMPFGRFPSACVLMVGRVCEGRDVAETGDDSGRACISGYLIRQRE